MADVLLPQDAGDYALMGGAPSVEAAVVDMDYTLLHKTSIVSAIFDKIKRDKKYSARKRLKFHFWDFVLKVGSRIPHSKPNGSVYKLVDKVMKGLHCDDCYIDPKAYPPNPDVLEAVKRECGEGKKVFVLTSSSAEAVRHYLDALCGYGSLSRDEYDGIEVLGVELKCEDGKISGFDESDELTRHLVSGGSKRDFFERMRKGEGKDNTKYCITAFYGDSNHDAPKALPHEAYFYCVERFSGKIKSPKKIPTLLEKPCAECIAEPMVYAVGTTD